MLRIWIEKFLFKGYCGFIFIKGMYQGFSHQKELPRDFFDLDDEIKYVLEEDIIETLDIINNDYYHRWNKLN